LITRCFEPDSIDLMKPLAVEDRDDDDDIDVVVFSYNTLCSISI
jgi:hypothetical protein